MSVQEWDQRYREGEYAEAPAEPLLVEIASGLAAGDALDLACGTGRNAVWLCERGWRVTAVDASEAAIAALRARCAGVQGVVADLERAEYRIEPEAWDLIVVCRYLQRDLFEPLKRGVRRGGIVLATALVGEGRYRVRPGELPGHFRGWEMLRCEEGAEARMVARKTG
jgi:SAM-dependent methyltransferase